MAETKIEWTDKTWNPVTGCTKKSEGCLHCYAEVMARRLKGMGQVKYKNDDRDFRQVQPRWENYSMRRCRLTSLIR